MRNTEIPDQRVSNNVKTTEKWYKQNADAIIDYIISNSDKLHTSSYLDAANGVFKKNDYKYVLSTYLDTRESSELEKDLDVRQLAIMRDLDLLTPIKEKYMGEFISSYHNYQVYSLDPATIARRNKELGDMLMKQMLLKLQAVIAEKQAEEQGQEQGQSNPAANINIAEFMNKELENWKDGVVEKEQNALELLNSEIEARRKYVDAYFYWWATEEVYTYRKIVGNSVIMEVIDPREYYRVRSGNYFVEDDDFGMRRYTLTIQEIINEFYYNMEDGINEEQLKFLRALIKNNSTDKPTLPITTFYNLLGFDKSSDVPSDIKFCKQGDTTTCDHYVWTTETKIGILKYYDEFNIINTKEVSDDYELDESNGDISIEWKWINQKWEGWRFGVSDNAYIYLKPRVIQLPRELVSDVSKCKSPYNGISYIHEGNAKKPIPYRIKDYCVLYKIYSLLEEKWLNKFKSWLLVPESLISDTAEMTTSERLQQADVDSIFTFNDAQIASNPNAINSFKEVATGAVINYINILDQVKNSIKNEAFELANMNDTRLGQTGQYKGKSVSEYDYNQALKGTVWSLEMFNSFREKDYEANLDFSRAAWVNGKQGSYIDPGDDEPKYVDIDGMTHLGANVGIHVSNSMKLNNQASELKQLAFSLGQNDDPEVSAEAITNENIGSLKKIIKKASEAKRAFQMQMQTAKEQITLQTKQVELQNDREQRQHEEQMNNNDNSTIIQKAIMEIEKDIQIAEAKLQIDKNGNGYIDKEEANEYRGENNPYRDVLKDSISRRKQVLDEIKTANSIKNKNKK